MKSVAIRSCRPSSHEAAAKIFGKDHPHLQWPGAWIEITEIMPVPGM